MFCISEACKGFRCGFLGLSSCLVFRERKKLTDQKGEVCGSVRNPPSLEVWETKMGDCAALTRASKGELECSPIIPFQKWIQQWVLGMFRPHSGLSGDLCFSPSLCPTWCSQACFSHFFPHCYAAFFLFLCSESSDINACSNAGVCTWFWSRYHHLLALFMKKVFICK